MKWFAASLLTVGVLLCWNAIGIASEMIPSSDPRKQAAMMAGILVVGASIGLMKSNRRT